METDTELGGAALSIEQAAAAYVKANSTGADKGQPEEKEPEQGNPADDELLASDEDNSEDEGEPDPEGQSEEEDDAEPESDQGRFVASNGKVRLPDGTVSTVSDLIQGNLRHKDYTQKTMATAEDKRLLAEQSSAVKAKEQKVNEQFEYASKLLESITPQPPDAKMLESDPIGYMQEKARYEQFAAHFQYIQSELSNSKAEAEKSKTVETTESMKAKANAAMEALVGAVPALKDETKLKAYVADIEFAGNEYGFGIDELKAAVPYDHRLAMVLRDAAKWKKLQASKPKLVEQAKGRPPVQKSGKRLTPDAQREHRATEAFNRLKQTGTVENAAAAYLARQRRG